MNKYLKFLLFVVGILGIAYIIDYAIGTTVEKVLLPKQNNKYMYAYNGGGGEEIIILGASRAAHHYIPQIIEDSLGVKCFNYGCDGQNIYNQYAILNLLLNHTEKKPKAVILEVSSIDVLNTPTWNTEKLSVLHPYYSLDDTLKNVVRLQGEATSGVLNLSKLYAFNSNIHNLIKPLVGISNNEMCNMGYIPMYTKWEKPIEIKSVERKAADLNKVSYLKEFISICQCESIKILLINSPHYIKYDSTNEWPCIVDDLAKEYDVPFIDNEQDSYYLQYPNLFNEPFHLNDEGAKHYTQEVLPIIRNLLNN